MRSKCWDKRRGKAEADASSDFFSSNQFFQIVSFNEPVQTTVHWFPLRPNVMMYKLNEQIFPSQIFSVNHSN